MAAIIVSKASSSSEINAPVSVYIYIYIYRTSGLVVPGEVLNVKCVNTQHATHRLNRFIEVSKVNLGN